MQLDHERFARDVEAFCKGLAAQDPALPARLARYPELRRGLGILDLSLRTDRLRAQLEGNVRRLLREAPAKCQRVLLVAMGLDPLIKHHNLTARLQALEAELSYGAKKVGELKRQAISVCIHKAVSRLQTGPSDDPGYQIAESVAELKIDLDHHQPTEMIEERKIRSTADPLNEVRAKHGVLPPPPGEGKDEFEFQVLEGGKSISVERYPGDVIEHRVLLPYPLDRGAVHAYRYLYRFRPDQEFNHYFRVQPAEPHMLFETVRLAVVFLGRRPSLVWMVEGAIPRAKLGHPGVTEVSLDDAGRVEECFLYPVPGRVYGFGWCAD